MSLSRYTEALQAFASGRRMSIDDIAGHVGIGPYHAGRYVRELHAAGLVEPVGVRHRAGGSGPSPMQWRWAAKP